MTEIKKYIDKVVNFENLTSDEAVRAFQIAMNGGGTPAQVAALLVGLRMKGESVDEITAAAQVIRAKADKISAPENALDTCGTGGDNSGSYNISTTVAFVLAACGIPVAKHGNKAVSSNSGSADVLRQLGINIEADKTLMERSLREINLCFLMAPKFHSAMRYVAPVRQDLGMRTMFNVLGPLANPAGAKYQLMGVYSKKLVDPIAHVLANLGATSAWVVHGSDGMDEITNTGISYVAELKDGKVRNFELDPAEYGFEIFTSDDLCGGTEVENAREMREVLLGRGPKAYRDIVILNSAAGLVVAGKANDFRQGIELATNVLDDGSANQILLQFVEITNSLNKQEA